MCLYKYEGACASTSLHTSAVGLLVRRVVWVLAPLCHFFGAPGAEERKREPRNTYLRSALKIKKYLPSAS